MLQQYGCIQIDTERDSLISEQGMLFLKSYYMQEKEKSPQESFARAALAYCEGDYEFAQRIYDYVSNLWFMFASPVLSNAPSGSVVDGEWKLEKWKSMPISCFLMESPDTIVGQMDALKELAALSIAGGGVGLHNQIRAISEKAPGPIPFEKVIDSSIAYFRQGKTRRGAAAYYMDIDHPDIMEHIKFRIPTGGDSSRKSDNRKSFHNAVNITDEFVEAVLNDDDFDLKCPAKGDVRDTVKARELWRVICETRSLTGEPYLTFIDVANKALPEALKQKGLRIKGSNLCVAPETKILTDAGYKKIASLEDQQVNVWNGKEWSNVIVRKTGIMRSLIKVTINNGKALECTPGHKFYIQKGDDPAFEVMAKDLKSGDKLIEWVSPEQKVLPTDVIESVTDEGRVDDTFCFTEPLRHMGVFNGILTGQCNEIYLPTSSKRTAVCCLSSVNLEKFDEWKNTTMIQDLIRLLDNVLQMFIDNAPYSLKKSVASAMQERSLGLGAMGYHGYLMSKNIAWETGGFNSATQMNHIMFSKIHEEAHKATRQLALEKGEAPDMKGWGVRNAHLIALAPNASSSVICNCTAATEPINSNAFVSITRVGSHVVRNKFLVKLLEERVKDEKIREYVWNRIERNSGSINNLELTYDGREIDPFTEQDKEVFKTAWEIDQHWVVQHAEDRQQYVCQGQSVNLFFPEGSSGSYVNSVHLKAARGRKLKGLYYYRTEAQNKADTHKSVARRALIDWKDTGECISCEG